jgi:hypothetical protein
MLGRSAPPDGTAPPAARRLGSAAGGGGRAGPSGRGPEASGGPSRPPEAHRLVGGHRVHLVHRSWLSRPGPVIAGPDPRLPAPPRQTGAKVAGAGAGEGRRGEERPLARVERGPAAAGRRSSAGGVPPPPGWTPRRPAACARNRPGGPAGDESTRAGPPGKGCGAGRGPVSPAQRLASPATPGGSLPARPARVQGPRRHPSSAPGPRDHSASLPTIV